MRFLLRHKTTYRYANPVTLGRHRLMLRPRDSHEMKLHEATLSISPTPSQVVWHYDVFGNSIALVDFDTTATELVIDSSLDVERFAFVAPEGLLAEHVQNLPLAYSADEIRDLAGLQERHVPDPEHQIDLWAKSFLSSRGEGPEASDTVSLIRAMAAAIKENFEYIPRDIYGTQSPLETLARRSGTCRDYAYFMMEALRSLGLAARFVSGYIYDSSRDPGASAPGVIGGGATHAWVQIYLPGAGWTHVDPTNALTTDIELIPVAIVRDPHQASPVSGSIEAFPGDPLGMSVDLSITSPA
ncbi:MAG: transglutaminase family protein [Alphaproteobacteria bacterium]|nr:transglutaminase family protein [Alphaproteobacteria bacterium]